MALEPGSDRLARYRLRAVRRQLHAPLDPGHAAQRQRHRHPPESAQLHARRFVPLMIVVNESSCGLFFSIFQEHDAFEAMHEKRIGLTMPWRKAV